MWTALEDRSALEQGSSLDEAEMQCVPRGAVEGSVTVYICRGRKEGKESSF